MRAASERACLVLRHAVAVPRHSWDPDDAERPLSPRGERQAEEIAKRTAAFGVARVLSSPAVRCTSTVAPLALAVGLVVDTVEFLAEGSDGAEALTQLMAETEGLDEEATLVACSHGDVLTGLIAALGRSGTFGPALSSVQKGGGVSLSVASGTVVGAVMIGPPK